MTEIRINIPPKPALSYPIRIDTELLSRPETWLPEDWQKRKIVIITDDTVQALHSDVLLSKLSPSKPLVLSIPPGEQSKNYQTKYFLEEQMLANHCDRNTLLLALGGGVVGDLAGFIAATYMRGISYVQLPTTLLAMVDSSVGGKTSINTSQGKNLIGAFWQPTAVIADMHCLLTLPSPHLINGFIEAFKMFLTHDRDSVDFAIQNTNSILERNPLLLQSLITRAVAIKSAVVCQDEQENHQRMLLNFGHTIGHALEKLSDYTMLHGHAVGLGILVEAKLSQRIGILSAQHFQLIQQQLARLSITGLELSKMDSKQIIQATQSDKKRKDNAVRYVLLKEPGNVYSHGNTYAHPIEDEMVSKALTEVSEV